VRCAYHPDRNAVAQCGQCKKPLCEECATAYNEGTTPLCGSCLMRKAAEDAAHVLHERREESEERRQSWDLKRKKKARVLPIVAASFAVVILLINLFLYLTAGSSKIEPFDPYKDPLLTAILINSAIQDYAETHEGRFPQGLTDLLTEEYLPSEKITEAVLKGYAYSRSDPRSYELRIKETEGGRFFDIVFTQEDR
jgi:hypothetical protein